jgi:hypothetical protein
MEVRVQGRNSSHPVHKQENMAGKTSNAENSSARINWLKGKSSTRLIAVLVPKSEQVEYFMHCWSFRGNQRV